MNNLQIPWQEMPEKAELEAFLQDVLDRHGRYMLDRAYCITGNWHESEDVVQEVMLALLSHLREGKRIEHLGGWLSTAVRGTALNLLTRRRARERRESACSLVAVGGEVEVPAIEDMLHMLTTQQRKVVLLRTQSGMSCEDIGLILGCSAETVRVHYHRAVSSLRECYGVPKRG